jgi:stage III sporulation protein AB
LWGKWLGAFMIIGSTTYLSWQVASRYARRPLELRELQTALALMQTEVEYGMTPLPQALLAATRGTGDRIGSIFRRTADYLAAGTGITAGEAMQVALVETKDETALTENDQAVLLALGSVLGSSGRHDQVRHLRLAMERLAGEESRALADRDRYEKVARYLGPLSGAALVLILL